MNVKRLLLCASISITMLSSVAGLASTRSWTLDAAPPPPPFGGGQLPGSIYGNGNLYSPMTGGTRVVSSAPVPPVPEPSSLYVIGAGVSALAFALRYRKHRKA